MARVAVVPVAGLARAPAVLHLAVTKKCNLSCPSCFYRGAGENPAIVERVVRDAAEHPGVLAVAIGGGEPLLHPKLPEYVELLSGAGKTVSVTTNGTLWRPLRADRVAISFDRLHEATWRSPGRVLGNARRFAGGCDLWVNHVLTDIPALERTLDLFSGLADAVVLLVPKPPELPLDRGLWEEAMRLVRERGFRLALDACVAEALGVGKCRQGVVSMSVEADGSCALCSNVREGRVPYRGIEETWRTIPRECPFGLR
ncbi:MAG: hypothetical protein DRN06_08955, partial [Thermoprotei archaeon]